MDIIKKFMRGHKVLSKEEIYKLINEAQKGNIESRNKVIEHNLALVFRYAGSKWNKEDCFQEGIFGVIRAIEKFDTSKGFAFSTYAALWIKQAMMRYENRARRTVRVPEYALVLQNQYKRLRAENEHATDEFLVRLIAKSKKVHPITVLNAIKADKSYVSIDAPVPGETNDMKFQLEDLTDDDKSYKCVDFEKLMKCLSERERFIIEKRFDDYTFQSISMEIGISRERVRQIQEMAMRKIRATLNMMDKMYLFK